MSGRRAVPPDGVLCVSVGAVILALTWLSPFDPTPTAVLGTLVFAYGLVTAVVARRHR